MTEDDFWRMIEHARSHKDGIESLGASLRTLSLLDIVSFNDILSKKIADAATFPVLAANFVIMSYVSDDIFRDFRAWLVSQGRDRYVAAVSDPETIPDWLDASEAQHISGESMLLAARSAYLAQGTEEEFFERTKIVRDRDIEQVWPESKSEYRRRFPKLVEKFWNQERIRELHSD